MLDGAAQLNACGRAQVCVWSRAACLRRFGTMGAPSGRDMRSVCIEAAMGRPDRRVLWVVEHRERF